MLLPDSYYDVVDGGHEGGTAGGLLDAPPPYLGAFVLVHREPLVANVEAPFPTQSEAKKRCNR